MGNHGKLNETQGAEMDEMIAAESTNQEGQSESEMIAAESTNQEGQSESVVGNGSIKCGCCDHEFPLENMVQCANGHQICFECIKKWVEEILYGNGSFKAHGSLSCISVDGCEESIPLSEIRRALPSDVLERYELRQALECVAEAKLKNLVYCPFCGIPYEVEKSVEVLDCQNQKCLKASCIQCKKPSHIPLRCEEVEEMSETARRTEVEEKKTKAVVRECNTCKVEIVKEGGCNKVTCPLCGTTMCYDCRETIASPYDVHVCRFSKEKTASFNKLKLCEKEVQDNDNVALVRRKY